ncbi:ferritin-like domain-containing protein [Actinoalloteichus hymeniacidonis]|uniref:DUF4439 family protein n=1 Tax=Actinoalloteichus hymeniacidonis TaxID=340345 RepID=A0AAC9HPI5_9PSEU|nr:ferritin-like domain-containing protein [Actinoalloteichus hymeniacidonis]AOS62646.1 putative DUF4439 family protein [Actinoalloteichus hymeniacidonis]MBB5909322.1 hypothetical protein [Actinoalloteichus hymeniacidonis]
MIDRVPRATAGDDPTTEETSGSNEATLDLGDAVESVQQALGAEHAAVWAYGLAAAFTDASVAEALAEGTRIHTDRRDLVETALRAQGTDPAPTEAAYQPPEPVTDHASAVAMLVLTESDCAAGWRAVLERAQEPELRGITLEMLTDAALRATRWRRVAGQTPSTVPFPGSPS